MDIEKIRQKILDLAIRGKLVQQDPNDEPASVLIEKIRKEKENLVKQGKIKTSKEDSFIYRGSDNCYYEKVGNTVKNITNEIPFEIPENWVWCRLGFYSKQVTDYVASGSFASLNENVKYYKKENYAILVRTCDFKNNFTKDLVWTDEHGYKFLSNSNLFGGEIIFSNIGASIGKIFIMPTLNKKATLAPNSIMLNLFNKNLHKYIYYLFLSAYGQVSLSKISFSSAQAKFNKTDFKRILIPIPPVKEQVNIINKLETLLKLINLISIESKDLYYLTEQTKCKILDNIFGENSCYKSYYEKEYKIGDILEYEQPAPYIVKNTEYSDNYETPVLTPGKTFILGYTNEKDGIYCVKNEKVIIFDDFTTASKLVGFNFKVKSSAMKILTIPDKKLFNIEYMYYLLQTIKLNNDTHKRYWISEFMPKTIKIHTLEEQKRIATIITNCFTILDSISSFI